MLVNFEKHIKNKSLLHGRMPEYNNKFAFDCGVDIWDYKPISWETVKYVMSKRVRHDIIYDVKSELCSQLGIKG